MHVTKNGRAGWVSPTLYKTNGKGEAEVNVSAKDGGAGLGNEVGYVLLATDAKNSTARKSAPNVLAAVKNGTGTDIFILAHPALNEAGEPTNKEVRTHSITRADLIKRCEALIEVSGILAPAEDAADKIAEAMPSPSILAAMPAGGKRGKRGGGRTLTV